MSVVTKFARRFSVEELHRIHLHPHDHGLLSTRRRAFEGVQQPPRYPWLGLNKTLCPFLMTQYGGLLSLRTGGSRRSVDRHSS
ncbi:hypothetical protein ACRALDRAFT_2057483 [Sodiomyces alcalophilus JCM 7366]|uniref:uncharacterized protein n=1 Tax=Sodiomyces alcalophilus JCM 7366 TaxID=591952 RepID=UPI0039B6875F